MSGLIVPIVQAATRHHLAIENEREGVASVEVVTDGESVLVVVTPDAPDVYPVTFEVRPR